MDRSDRTLRHSTDRKAMIRAALAAGLTVQKIVLQITRGESYAEVRALAMIWAAELGISQADFVRMAGRRS